MRLQEHWGVGPKTEELLTEELGREEALRAIERADLKSLKDAGLSRGRAARIVRRAKGGGGLDVLATPDSRDVYKDLLEIVGRHAVNDDAADRVSVVTPYLTREEARERLDDVVETRRALDRLDGDELVEALGRYERTERTAVEVALELLEVEVDDEFSSFGELDVDALEEALEVLSRLEGRGVGDSVDSELARQREALEAVESLQEDEADLVESLRDSGARDAGEVREAFVDHVVEETGLDYTEVEEECAQDAVDLLYFVGDSLRSVGDRVRRRVEEREQEVEDELREELMDVQDDVDEAVDAVEELGFKVSLAEFMQAYDLQPASYVEDGVAVEGARNLDLVLRGEEVQPLDYEVGGESHSERVAVLTGANSGGKTTLLETLCQVVLLAQMGLPVPAEHAEAAVFEDLVFHRRHSSFNAGVLESTLRSVVPPVAGGGDTLMLVDEFEAITEPGSAAELLHGLVTLTVERDALGVYVTHLADDLKPLPEVARIDGIFAEGLDDDLELQVDYQPRLGELGKSTPEFIVSRLIARADDGVEQQGFQVLAEAVGVEKVQSTLEEVDD